MISLWKVLRKGLTIKHEKLQEEWNENKELLLEGLTFYVKYLGHCIVQSANSEQSTADAIKNIIIMKNASGKKLEKVAFSITPTSVKTRRLISNDLLFEVPINRISYCSADAHFECVFAFIHSSIHDILECRAFLCANKKMAQAVTLTISQAFDVAYELWQSTRNTFQDNHSNNDEIQSLGNSHTMSASQSNIRSNSATEFSDLQESSSSSSDDEKLLIDFSSDIENNSHKEVTKLNSEVHNKVGFWDQTFPISSFSGIPKLRTNLCSETITDARGLVSQFVVQKSFGFESSQCFLQDDRTELLNINKSESNFYG